MSDRQPRRFVETLEARRLFSAVGAAVGVNSILGQLTTVTVNGTPANDFITVATTDTDIIITVNGVTQTHARNLVSAVNIFCGAGDDTVIASGSNFGIYVDGGDGNDKIVGSDGPDTVLGAAQKDIIYGGLGNDRLNGSGGNDKILGEAGADRLYAGNGNDFIDGGSSGDRFYPGGGSDTMLGQSGNDFFSALDNTADVVYGGSGTDTAFVDPQDIRGSIENVALV